MLPDAFTLLGLPARAALEDATLQSAWLQAARVAHPDQVGGDTALAAELNQALETLKSPVTRLKHLLQHYSDTPWRAVPLDAEMMQLFEKLGPLLQSTAALVQKKQAITSALAKALLAREEMQARESLEALSTQIENTWTHIEATLPNYDARLTTGDSSVWQELQGVQARLAYLEKWRSQIRAQWLALSLA